MADPQHLLFGFLFAVSVFVMMQAGSANQQNIDNVKPNPANVYNAAPTPNRVRDLDQEEEYPSREVQKASATIHQPNYGVGQTMIVKMLYCTS